MRRHDVLSVILGGGRGTRLFPLTWHRTKPAVPLAGRYRLIDIPISNCINSNVTKIFVLTQYLSASLHRHVYETYKFDMFSKGFVELLPAEQTLTNDKWYQGTADAVRQQLHRIESREPTDVMILAGDHLYRTDYSAFIKAHVSSGADVTVGALPVSEADAGRFGILETAPDHQITSFVEKPTDPDVIASLKSLRRQDKPLLGSMGIYIFRIEVLRELLDEGGDDFGRNILPAALGRKRLMAWLYDGYWEDIGTISSFYKANLALTTADRPFTFYDRLHPMYTRPAFLPASIVDGCTIDRSVISDGCQLSDARISDCVIGQRSVVEAGSELDHVLMLGADDYENVGDMGENERQDRPSVGIGLECRISRTIIDKNARIGDFVTIRSHEGEPDQDGDGYFIRDGIVVIPKNAVIPAHTVI